MNSRLYQSFYDALWYAATPFLKAHLRRRVKIGKEDAARLKERFGISNITRPSGKLVWMHGASVGESISLLPFIAQIRNSENPPTVLVTTGTTNSAKVMAERLPEGCIHQYFPLDRKKWVERFIAHWRPDGAVWCDSEIWPGIFARLRAHNIPAILINARISAGAVNTWSRFTEWGRDIANTFEVVAAQTTLDKQNWDRLGGVQAQLLGNLKFIGIDAPVDEGKAAVLRSAIQKRPIVMFSSIHPGEEIIAGDVHRKIKQLYPNVLTIVVPRHPHRGVEFETVLAAYGLFIALRSKQHEISATTDVYIADTMGEMSLFYSLTNIAVVGGSYVPHGGQNPIEAARHSIAILYGPHMFNFTGICAAFEEAGSVIKVEKPNDLAEMIAVLLGDDSLCTQYGEKAKEVVKTQSAALDNIWQAIESWREKVMGKS